MIFYEKKVMPQKAPLTEGQIKEKLGIVDNNIPSDKVEDLNKLIEDDTVVSYQLEDGTKTEGYVLAYLIEKKINIDKNTAIGWGIENEKNVGDVPAINYATTLDIQIDEQNPLNWLIDKKHDPATNDKSKYNIKYEFGGKVFEYDPLIHALINLGSDITGPLLEYAKNKGYTVPVPEELKEESFYQSKDSLTIDELTGAIEKAAKEGKTLYGRDAYRMALNGNIEIDGESPIKHNIETGLTYLLGLQNMEKALKAFYEEALNNPDFKVGDKTAAECVMGKLTGDRNLSLFTETITKKYPDLSEENKKRVAIEIVESGLLQNLFDRGEKNHTVLVPEELKTQEKYENKDNLTIEELAKEIEKAAKEGGTLYGRDAYEMALMGNVNIDGAPPLQYNFEKGLDLKHKQENLYREFEGIFSEMLQNGNIKTGGDKTASQYMMNKFTSVEEYENLLTKVIFEKYQELDSENKKRVASEIVESGLLYNVLYNYINNEIKTDNDYCEGKTYEKLYTDIITEYNKEKENPPPILGEESRLYRILNNPNTVARLIDKYSSSQKEEDRNKIPEALQGLNPDV